MKKLKNPGILHGLLLTACAAALTVGLMTETAKAPEMSPPALTATPPVSIGAAEQKAKVASGCEVIQTMAFTRCGHSVTRRVLAPEALTGADFAASQDYYNLWQLESFSPERLEMRREIPLFCPIHTVVGVNEAGDVVLTRNMYGDGMAVVRDTGRTLVRNVLIHDDRGHYSIDFEEFERQIRENNVKVYILCSPHNPVGRVWKREELVKAGDICLANGVLVFSDEIHADFVYEDNKHIPFASISKEYDEGSLTFTSPSKTFNIAGLQIAEIIVRDEKLRNAVRRAVNITGYAEVGITGLAAMKAAYTECDDWVDAVVEYIHGNMSFMEDFLSAELPMLRMTHPEGTYLPWIDCTALRLDRKGLEDLVRNKAKLWLDAGYIFGESGTGFQRFNAACPRKTLEEAMERLKRACCEQ